MSQAIEVKVPDIGDFSHIPVIEICVKPGDTVNAEDPLITLESEKATMDVPSPTSGIVREIRVGLGDHVSMGNVIALIEPVDAAAEEEVKNDTPPPPKAQAETKPAAPSAPPAPSPRRA